MMKVMKRGIGVLLALLMCLSGTAMAESGLSVNGSATVQLKPDVAMISLGVTAKAQEVLKAQESANEAINEVIRVLTDEMSLAKEDIATSEYRIDEEYQYNRETGNSVHVGYIATYMLNVRVDAIDQAGAVIDAAMKAGANRLEGVTFRSSDEYLASDQALKLAVEDALRKARVIADAAEITLPQAPVSIIENGISVSGASNSMARYDAIAEGAVMDAGTQLESGMMTVSASVKLVYDID